VAALAAAAPVLKGWYPSLAKECLDAAVKLWNKERAHPTQIPGRFRRFAGFLGAQGWSAALNLMIATNGAEPYEQRVENAIPGDASKHRVPGLNSGASPALSACQL
jgi:endoglucanase